jgi:hypothetical protein
MGGAGVTAMALNGIRHPLSVGETDDGEDGKDSKDNASAPEVFAKVINSGTNSEGLVQYASGPNKLLCKGASTKEGLIFFLARQSFLSGSFFSPRG